MGIDTRQAVLGLGVVLAFTILLAPSAMMHADDTDLFTARVTPNVLLMVDNSNSMNEIMEHPAYDRDDAPFGCDVVPTSPAGTSGNVNDDNGIATPYRCTIIGCFVEFDDQIAGFTPTATTSDDPETGYIERTFCGERRRIYHDGGITNVGGNTSLDNETRWIEPYIEWYFSLDTSDTTTTHPPTNQTAAQIVADILDEANGRDYIDGSTYGLFHRARISGVRQIATEVIYQTNSECPPYAGDCGIYQDNIRFGLAKFHRGSHGGYVTVPVGPYDAAQRTALANEIYALDPQTNTPLSETLFKLYTYFMHRTDSNQRPAGAINSAYRFPAYSYVTSDGDYTSTIANAPPDPVVASCQKHFIIVITDGEPTSDDFSTSGSETQGFSDFKTRLVGDLAPDTAGDLDYGTDATPEEGNPPFNSNGGTGWLDDIAHYMQTNDMRLDHDGFQKVDVYTIGFDTFGMVSSLLRKTADRGNGLFSESSQASALSTALVDAINDIILKAQVFTAATVPASRTTAGDNFYAAYFVPVQDSPFWEGHLKNFEYSASGEPLTVTGTCAIGVDSTATPPCPTTGALRTDAAAHWDASAAMPAPGSRNLYLELGATSMFAQPTDLTIPSPVSTGTAWFGLTTSDNGDAPYSSLSPNATADMTQALIRYLRGCTFSNSSTCTPRTDVTTTNEQYLGDIFHSNPVVVGSPNSAINEASYKAFANAYRTRPRVIYAGANDGFLHGFHAGAWDTGVTPPRHDRGTGEELMGFMPYGVRDKVRDYVKFSSGLRTDVLVDGSPVVSDVWFHRNVSGGVLTTVNPTLATKQVEQWRTVLIQTLRDGGEHISALDITDPPASASTSTTTYPRYLWGFPADDPANAVNGATSTETAYVGNTWSEPVITRVRVKADGGTDPRGYERWVAIFGGGYNGAGDPNNPNYRSPGDPGFTPKGRAIYMVDITTGQVLAKKVFDDTATPLDSATSEQVGIKELRYSIASAPAVFDLDFDGFADVVYIGDLGGNLWKWVVKSPGDDPINNTIADDDLGQPNWPFRLYFRGSASTEPPPELSGSPWNGTIHYQSFYYPPTGVLRQGKLVLAFGAGDRADPIGPTSEFGDGTLANNSHYYVLRDGDPLEQVGTAPDPIGDAYVEGDLADFDAPTPLTCSQMLSTKQGYYITGRDAEKFISPSTIFLGNVFTGSFLPADPSTTTQCDSRGESYLYGFDLECGVGKFQSEPGDERDKRRTAIGSGVPTRPRVSVGDLNQGGGSGGCNNRIVVVTSDGEVWNDGAGCLPSSGVRVHSWRER